MEITTTCKTCEGTGVDIDFGSTCTECEGGTKLTRNPTILPDDMLKVQDLAAWLSQQTWSDFAQSLARFYQTKGYLSEKQIASATKMKDKCDARDAERSAKAAAKPAATERITEDGMYRTEDGTIYKVQFNREKTNLYAKRLIQNGDSHSFEYAAGVVYKLAAADKMSLEQAKEFGALYGTCCVCARVLTNESSIEDGIGPICAQKF